LNLETRFFLERLFTEVSASPGKEEAAAFWERIRRAREMSPAETFVAGPRVFEEECEAMREEIRKAHPHADGPKVEAILHACLEAKREEEERDYTIAYYEVRARD
jgi:hypothetical protein